MLTKRELAVLDEAQSCELCLMPTEHRGKPWWKLEVRVPSENKVFEVQTTLGELKVWKDLDVATAFIAETCIRAKSVRVILKD